MKNFRTYITIPASKDKLSYSTKSQFIGSCFTENTGEKLKRYKFPVDVNPFGIIYNPVSVKNSLDILIKKKRFTKKDLLYHDERWFSFYHHSIFSDPDYTTCLKKINDRISYSSDFLKEARFLFITFGTAWVYKHKQTDKVVSNCHKIPDNEFVRQLLGYNEIVSEYSQLIKKLTEYNPNIRIIFTVSPIRHWKDGAFGNQVSKATLLLAINELKNRFPNVDYFPAYEIIMDELRDYRYYAEDMIHLNNTGEKYVWDRFIETYIRRFAQGIMNDIEKVLKAMEHKPFNPESESYRNFVKNNLGKIYALKVRHKQIDLSKEEAFFKSKLNK